MQASRNTRLRYPGGRGALWGVVAYLAGYLAFVAAFRNRVAATLSEVALSVGPETESVAEMFATDPAPAWKVAGWLFYNAHFVPVSLPHPSGDVVEANLLLRAGGLDVALVVVPPVVLVAAGALATRRAEGTTDLRFDLGATAESRYAANGALLAMLGYLPLVLAGWVATGARVPLRDVAVAPNPVLGWLVAGLLYPVVFGGVGGLVGVYRE